MYGYLSIVNVVCCQVEFSATSRSVVQRSPTDRVLSVISNLRKHRSARSVEPRKNSKIKDTNVEEDEVNSQTRKTKEMHKTQLKTP